MRLRELRKEDMPLINQWRNASKESLRTSGPETLERQMKWYEDLPNRHGIRFWGIEIEPKYQEGDWLPWDLVGTGGFTDISLENRNAEISLLLNPFLRGKGYGEQAVDLLLEQAFDYMNLHTVYGECYYSNKRAIEFWAKMVNKYDGTSTILSQRKFLFGEYWNSYYFTFWGVLWNYAKDVSCPEVSPA